jgi:DNA-binding transcriptional ArsR family regulator
MNSEPIFAALSNPHRRRLMEMLISGPATPGAMARQFALSRPAVSEHLAVLRAAELVREDLRGRERFYSLNVEPLAAITDWLRPFEAYARERLAILRDILAEPSR